MAGSELRAGVNTILRWLTVIVPVASGLLLWRQLADDSIEWQEALQATVAEVVAAHPEHVAAYRGGKKAAIGWFLGQVMKKTAGRANPRVVNELLRKSLDSDA